MGPMTGLPIAHLLVPLDGSPLAESALPAAMALARHLPARVTLLHVLERAAPETIHGERHLKGTGEAEAYLADVASRFAEAGIAVASHTHPDPEGDVAGSIAVHARAQRADLIVMCAHGRGGLRDWFSGAIAQRVIRHGGAPVLMMRQASTGEVAPFAPRTILVALDGTAEGEAALPAALTFAGALGAALHLLVVVETLATVRGDRAAAARLTPRATSAALDLASDEARAYLERLRARLAATGVVVTAEVDRGEAARVVVADAERHGASLIALATHGRAGLDALWSASVGSRVVARSGGPLLLTPAVIPAE